MQRILSISDKRLLLLATATRLLKKPKAKKEAKRFVKYGIVGVLGTIIDFSILNILIFFVGWSTPFGKLSANIVSTGVAIISNFICHRAWTFPESQSRNGGVQLLQFTIVSIAGLLLNTLVFYLAGHYFFELFLPMTIAIQLAKATASVVILFWNFGVNRLWTYRGL
ncbi:MAG: GtrA family protein [Anaerolineae bacterium]|nr:GtrA family protein [Anaerolineae bacterium]